MSRKGKLPIKFLSSTKVEIVDDFIIVSGATGTLKQKLNDLVDVKIEGSQIIVTVKNQKNKAMQGLYRSLINNMIIGIEEGFEKKLEINGVGYSIVLNGKVLDVKVGFSHVVNFSLPEGIIAEVDKKIVTIKGIDKQQVGQVTADIRKIRKPEPYKGKGIKYLDEVILRKEGKSAKSE